MAVAIRSIGAQTSGNTWVSTSNAITFAKPTGLAAGDLMLAIIGAKPGTNGATTGAFVAPAGWTQVGTVAFTSNTLLQAFWKIADSTDAAASSFVFLTSGTPTNSTTTGVGGWLYAITGADGTTPIITNAQGTANGATATVTGGVTPGVANCMLFFGACLGATTGTYLVANVAVVNNNPTWTRQNFSNFSATSITTAVATGTYAATTSTGNGTWTNGATNNYGAKLIAVQPQAAATVNLDMWEPHMQVPLVPKMEVIGY